MLKSYVYCRRALPARVAAKPAASGKPAPSSPPPYPSIRTKGLSIDQYKWTSFTSASKPPSQDESHPALTPTTRTPAPISVLPPELLEEIFLTIIWSSYNEPTGSFKPLTLVCREWCSIVRRLELVVLNISGGGALIDKAIERVKGLRTDRNYASTQALIIHGPYNRRELHRLSDLVDLFGPTARHLTMYGYWPSTSGDINRPDREAKLRPLRGGFKHVKELCVKAMPSSDVSMVVELCNFEVLEHIDLFSNHLSTTSLHWLKGVKLPRLRTLRCADISATLRVEQEERTITGRRVTSFFASLPVLVTLQITTNFWFVDAFVTSLLEDGPKSLANMELWLCGYSATDHDKPALPQLQDALNQRTWSTCEAWTYSSGGSRYLLSSRLVLWLMAVPSD